MPTTCTRANTPNTCMISASTSLAMRRTDNLPRPPAATEPPIPRLSSSRTGLNSTVHNCVEISHKLQNFKQKTEPARVVRNFCWQVAPIIQQGAKAHDKDHTTTSCAPIQNSISDCCCGVVWHCDATIFEQAEEPTMHRLQNRSQLSKPPSLTCEKIIDRI